MKSQRADGESAVIIHRLAETIDDVELREGFLTAVFLRSILGPTLS